jgi:capsular polysaccharide biosynthesis protein
MSKKFFENNYLILLNIWSNRYKMVIFPIVFAIIFSFFHSIIPEKYKVELSLLIQDTSELNPQLSDLSTNPIQRKTIFYEDLIKSQKVLDSAIQITQFSDKEDEDFKDRMREGISLKQTSYNKNDRNVFKVSFKWDDRNQIKLLFKEINSSFIREFNKYNIDSINKSKYFITEQLRLKKEEILASEKKIIDFKIKHKDIATNLMGFDYKENTELEKKIREKEIDYLSLKEKFEILQLQLLRDNPVKKMIESKIAEHEKNLSNYRLVYTEEHSSVIREKKILKELNDKLFNINEQNALNVSEIKDYLIKNNGSIPYFLLDKIHELEDLKIERNKSERELVVMKELKKKQQEGLEQFGELYVTMKDLEQDLEIKEERYNKLLEKEEFIKITEELKKFEKQETIQIMNQNSLEVISLKPPKIVYIIIGFVFGVFLVLSLSVFAFLINQNVIKRKDAESILDSKVITRVPHIRNIEVRK